MNANPDPNPNLEDRLKKLAAAQQDITAMTPSPEQVAYEQLLEMHAQSQKTAADIKAGFTAATTQNAAAVEKALEEHRAKMEAIQTASEGRISDAVKGLKPETPNRTLKFCINVWGSIIVGLVVMGIFILIATSR